MEGNFTVFFFVLLCIWGQFPSTSPLGGFYLGGGGGDLKEGFLRYEFGGAYTWRGLFSEFYGILGFFDYPIFPELAWKTTQP